MSINNIREIKKYIKGLGDDVRLYSKIDDTNSFNWYEPLEVQESSAIVIEDNNFEIKLVPVNTYVSKFSYFIDGIERKKIIGDYNHIPFIYGYLAAAIIKRIDKKLYSSGLETSSDALYVPLKKQDAPDNYFVEQDFDFPIIDTGIYDKIKKRYPVYPDEFEKVAHSYIQECRRKMEKDLAEKWLNQMQNSKEDWLFIDGRLEPLSEKLKNDSQAVGVIKSHRTYYFEPENQYKIYGMKKGERTSVFQPQKIDKHGKTQTEKVYSWYLRLHDNQANGDINSGIIRVEAPCNDKILRMVDEISSWILLETNPIAFPASRWDKMIYPIKYVEDYLKSKAPTMTQITSLSI